MSNKKILIIEDDKFIRDLISTKLAQENYEVLEAKSGKEGIQKIKKEKPDLVLLDLILPEIDGFEVLARIKTDPTIASIPVVILSNLDQKEHIQKCEKMGAVAYFVKAHLTPTELIEKIKNFI